MLRYDQVYIYHPRGVETGGPEALHQLAWALSLMGQEAFLVPLPGTADRDPVPAYRRYETTERTEIVDRESNAVVVPETHVQLLANAHEAHRICWWLSVNNAPLYKAHFLGRRGDFGESALRVLARRARYLPRAVADRRMLNHASHLFQSRYAQEFVSRELGYEGNHLSDITSFPSSFRMPSEPSGREPAIAYNFSKGGDLVELLRSSRHWRTRLKWIPIRGMSKPEVWDTFGRSVIYLDLGHHPGKDRMPREAAAAGAITMLANRGAAASGEDYQIPPEHKLRVEGNWVPDAVKRIEGVLHEPSASWRKQGAFRERIRCEEATFLDEVASIFLAQGLPRSV